MLRVTVDSYEQARDCPLRNVLDKVGDKWSFLIFAVLEDGPKRFNDIKRDIGDISQRVLTRNLRALERDGYIRRTVYPVSPPRVEYSLTSLGTSLLKPVADFMSWALQAYPKVLQAREAYDVAHNESPSGAAGLPSIPAADAASTLSRRRVDH